MATHTLDLLEHAIELAERLDFGVRTEWLEGMPSGFCRIRGKRWIFLDISESATERLQHLTMALATCSLAEVSVRPELMKLIEAARRELTTA